jgi:hypothetical protein
VSFININCANTKTQYAMQVLPAGTYAFTALTLNQIIAGFHLFFNVVPNKVTYIGHLAITATKPIKARNVTFDTVNAGVIRFRLTDHATRDLAYFKAHYPNIRASIYRVQLGRLRP